MEAASVFGTLVTTYETTRCYISEDLNLPECCASTRTLLVAGRIQSLEPRRTPTAAVSRFYREVARAVRELFVNRHHSRETPGLNLSQIVYPEEGFASSLQTLPDSTFRQVTATSFLMHIICVTMHHDSRMIFEAL